MSAIITSNNVTVQYREPSLTKTGTPLTDLSYTSVFYTIGGGPEVKAIVNPPVGDGAGDVPASSPTGGQLITAEFTIPAAPPDAETSVEIYQRAYDDDGNPSLASLPDVIIIDKLAPAAPEHV